MEIGYGLLLRPVKNDLFTHQNCTLRIKGEKVETFVERELRKLEIR